MIVTDIKKLKVVSEDVKPEEVDAIVEKLKKANETAWCKGCGLAAIQIGIPKRVAWLVYNGEEEVLINPIITKGRIKSKEKEGCLSIPHQYFLKTRFKKIEYISNGITKKATGFKARVIQHEIDHMDGILVSDSERGAR